MCFFFEYCCCVYNAVLGPALKQSESATRMPIGMPAGSVAQPCPTLCDPVDCSPPGSSVHGTLQARTGSGLKPRLLHLRHWQAGSFTTGLPWRLGWERICLPCRRPHFHRWVRKVPWRRETATHSSILAWRIPWTEEPGGLQSMGSQRVRYN